ncbi:hypothetical protein QEJ31_00760 [Pigmentibacter sp. JX0631]|uniref:hypothetical protein n=1 Tax=Pigmentibacter sp. JX0631 TaxID=2976982 RepID=UPI002468EB5B|nr:hypothetical protein [Pigmentibacter sp. JX0631]WGL60133.1 hypothetical protein QEJ31_00760 [Pigmentibacter sp. JX0631]
MTTNIDIQRKLAFTNFCNYVKNNDIIILGESHSESSPAFNILIDYFLHLFSENENIDYSEYCIFLEGLPRYYYKPNHLPEIISSHQFFSWIFYYFGIDIRGLEHQNHLKERIENAKNAVLHKKSINSNRNFNPVTNDEDDDFTKRSIMTKRILKSNDFSETINQVISNKQYKKIFIICGSVHGIDMQFNFDRYLLEKTFYGINFPKNKLKIIKLLLDELKENRSLKINDDFNLHKKIALEDPISLPRNFNLSYRGFYDYNIYYPDAKNNLAFLVINKLFSSYLWNYKIMSTFFDTNIYEIKTFYEIQQERKIVIYSLPKIFTENQKLYNSIYRYKIVKIIEKNEKYFNLNYLKDWNPIPDRGLVLRTTNKLLDKQKQNPKNFIEEKKHKFNIFK